MSESIAQAPIGASSGLFTGAMVHPQTVAPSAQFVLPAINPPSVTFWLVNTLYPATLFGTPGLDYVIAWDPAPLGLVTQFGAFKATKKPYHILLPEFQRVFNDRLKDANITAEVAWPNLVYRPKKGVSYLKPENGGRTRMPLGMGADGVQQWQGIYQVGVFAPRDTGELEQERLATKVMAAFPRGMTLSTVQAIDVKISHSTAPAPVPFGDWSNLPVSVYWFAVEPPL